MTGSNGDDSGVPLDGPADSHSHSGESSGDALAAKDSAAGDLRSKSLPPRKARAGAARPEPAPSPEDDQQRESKITLVGGHAAPPDLLKQAEADRGSHPSPPSWDHVQRSLQGDAKDQALTDLDSPFVEGTPGRSGAPAPHEPNEVAPVAGAAATDPTIDAAVDAAIDQLVEEPGRASKGSRPEAPIPTPWPLGAPGRSGRPVALAARAQAPVAAAASYPSGTPLRTMTTLSSLAPVEGTGAADEDHGSPLLGVLMVAAMAIVGVFGWIFTQDGFNRTAFEGSTMAASEGRVAAGPVPQVPARAAMPAVAAAAPVGAAVAAKSLPVVPAAPVATVAQVPAVVPAPVVTPAIAIPAPAWKPPLPAAPVAAAARGTSGAAKVVAPATKARARQQLAAKKTAQNTPRPAKVPDAAAQTRASRARSGSRQPAATESRRGVLQIRRRGGAPVTPAAAGSDTIDAAPSREAVVKAMNRVRDLVKTCRAGRSGVAEVELVVAAQGVVTHAVVSGDFAGSPEGSCIARAVRRARFDPFSRPSVRLVYPFAL